MGKVFFSFQNQIRCKDTYFLFFVIPSDVENGSNLTENVFLLTITKKTKNFVYSHLVSRRIIFCVKTYKHLIVKKI